MGIFTCAPVTETSAPYKAQSSSTMYKKPLNTLSFLRLGISFILLISFPFLS